MKSHTKWAPASRSMLHAHMIPSSYTRKDPADTEVLTAVLLMARVFCDMTLCRTASCYRRFEGTILWTDGSHSPTTYSYILDEMSSRKRAFWKQKKMHRLYQEGRTAIREYVLVIDITKPTHIRSWTIRRSWRHKMWPSCSSTYCTCLTWCVSRVQRRSVHEPEANLCADCIK